MTPSGLYQNTRNRDDFCEDAAQAQAIAHFDTLHQQLVSTHDPWQGIGQRLRALTGMHQKSVPGFYLWGGVGRGKTWLMDLFFDSLPFPAKLRLHFHHFMQIVHDELALLKGRRDPLQLVAANLAKHARVICLDEFHVDDITDAMLLYGLLDALFKQGVTLVVTSNQPPDDLYKNGLQRERFLPAIGLIKQFTHVMRMDGGTDHRLRKLETADTWYTPLYGTTDQQLHARFQALAPCPPRPQDVLHINYREIVSVMCADDVVWFEFETLCNSPRATPDYIEIARRFHTVFVSGIPQLNEATDDKATRFINLIDEFYDRNIKLVASAACPPAELYTGRQLAFEFQRTRSRLEEMRSRSYLARPHKA
jgi:cell division protein ZapE